MILTGNKIIEMVQSKAITINPFTLSQVNPNSYDIRLGYRLLNYTNPVLDSRKPNPIKETLISESGYQLSKGEFYLGHTVEEIGSIQYVPILHNKSGLARLGLFIHITADLIDIGSFGNLTLQLYPTLDIIVYPGMLIGQVSFWESTGKITAYNGKYQHSKGPVSSKNYLNL